VIVICGVILVVIIVFAAKKTVDWVQLRDTAGAHFHNNPLAIDRDSGGANAAYESPR